MSAGAADRVRELLHRMPESSQNRLTDSPWFWGLLFSVMALVSLALVSPKYDRRQGQIEGRYLGRGQLAAERARRAAGLQPSSLAEDAVVMDEAPRSRLIPLWPLAIAAAGSSAACGWMLMRKPAPLS
jgi:hypothetical protein